jgi:hypothetical protein
LRYAQIDFSALATTGLKGHALEMIIPVGRELKRFVVLPRNRLRWLRMVIPVRRELIWENIEKVVVK